MADDFKALPCMGRAFFIQFNAQISVMAAVLLCFTEYSRAAEPPVRCGESHMSGLTGATLL